MAEKTRAPRDAAAGALWDPGQTAQHVNVSEKTLAQWRWRRVGPPWLKLAGGRVRYRPAAVERWLDQQTQDGDGGAVA